MKPTRFSKSLFGASAFTALLVGTPTLTHAQATWVGDVDSDWNNAANWSSDPAAPTGNFTVNNTAGPGVSPVVSANSAFTPVDLFVGIGAGQTGQLDQTAGTLATGNGNWTFIGRDGGTGVFNTSGGTFTTGELYIGGAPFAGAGTGTLNINGGAVTADSTANFGDESGANIALGVQSGSSGTINLQSGSLTAATGEIKIGTSAGATGIVNQSGGTASYAGYTGIGRFGTGTYNLSGGTVNASTVFGFTTIGGAGGSVGNLNVSGGTWNATNGGMIVGEGWTGSGTAAGTLTVSGGGIVDLGTNGLQLATTAIATGTVNLNGGTIQAGSVFEGDGTGTFNFNGGTLTATNTSATFMQGLTAANVQNGGAIINSNGFDITIGQALIAAGSGGLTKTGAGTLTLTNAANTYTGATTVLNGTLATTGLGELGLGNVTVADTLGATLTLGNATGIADTATLLFGSNSTVNLNFEGADVVGTITNGSISIGQGTHDAVTLNSFFGTSTFTGTGALTIVPEPSVALLGGLGVLGLLRRRRLN